MLGADPPALRASPHFQVRKWGEGRFPPRAKRIQIVAREIGSTTLLQTWCLASAALRLRRSKNERLRSGRAPSTLRQAQDRLRASQRTFSPPLTCTSRKRSGRCAVPWTVRPPVPAARCRQDRLAQAGRNFGMIWLFRSLQNIWFSRYSLTRRRYR